MKSVCIKIKIILPFLILGITSVYSQPQSEMLQITGKLKWLNENESIVLKMLDGENAFTSKQLTVDSCSVKKGEFHLKTKIYDGPRLFFIYFLGHPNRFTHVFANNEKITIEDGINDLPEVGYISPFIKITGSPTTNAFINLFPLQHVFGFYWAGFNSYITKIEDSVGFDSKLVEATIIAKDKFVRSLLFEFGSLSKQTEFSQIIPNIIFDNYVRIGKEHGLLELYNMLDEKSRNSYYGKILKESLGSVIGQAAPDFEIISENQQASRLKNLISESKLTLLYFWSLDPRRPRGNMIFELSRLYKKYHAKGFNIVSVFVGADSANWKKTIIDDALPWYHAADFNGADKGICKKYGFTWATEPFTILIDGNGKILTWRAQGAILEYYINSMLPK